MAETRRDVQPPHGRDARVVMRREIARMPQGDFRQGRVADEQDAPPPQRQKVRGRQAPALHIVAAHQGIARLLAPPAPHHDAVFQRANGVEPVLAPRLPDDDQPVRTPRLQQAPFRDRGLVLGRADQEVVAAPGRGLRHRPHHFEEERVRNRFARTGTQRDHQSQGLARLPPQVARRRIDGIAHLVGDAQDLRLGAGFHERAVIERARHRGHVHARETREVRHCPSRHAHIRCQPTRKRVAPRPCHKKTRRARRRAAKRLKGSALNSKDQSGLTGRPRSRSAASPTPCAR